MLECGGKNPCIVLDDAEHLDVVAKHVTQAVLWNMGENCSATSRLIVHRSIKDKLVSAILERVRDWPLGNPLDPENRLGAIVSKEQYESILAHISKGKAEGAEMILGEPPARLERGYFIAPTIFDNVRPEMTIAREEIFGPESDQEVAHAID